MLHRDRSTHRHNTHSRHIFTIHRCMASTVSMLLCNTTLTSLCLCVCWHLRTMLIVEHAPHLMKCAPPSIIPGHCEFNSSIELRGRNRHKRYTPALDIAILNYIYYSIHTEFSWICCAINMMPGVRIQFVLGVLRVCCFSEESLMMCTRVSRALCVHVTLYTLHLGARAWRRFVFVESVLCTCVIDDDTQY